MEAQALAITHHLAQALQDKGYAWTVADDVNDTGQWYATLLGPNGAKIGVHHPRYGPAVLEINAAAPGPFKGYQRDEPRAKMSAKATRTPASIAGDVIRKIIPTALELADRWRAESAEYASADEARAATVAQILAAFPGMSADSRSSNRSGAPTSDELRWHTDGSWGHLTIGYRGDRITLEAHDLTAGQAADIARILATS